MNDVGKAGTRSRLIQAFCGVTKWMLTRPASPIGIVSSDMPFGEGGSTRYRLTDKGPLPPVIVEINPGVGGGVEHVQEMLILTDARGGRYIPRP